VVSSGKFIYESSRVRSRWNSWAQPLCTWLGAIVARKAPSKKGCGQTIADRRDDADSARSLSSRARLASAQVARNA
jgi:hypothetical protein